MEQMIGEYLLNGQVKESRVWTRLLPNEVAIMFGTFPRKNCLLEKVRHILKTANRTEEASMIKQFAKEKDFKKMAREQFQKYDILLNEAQPSDPSDSAIMNEFVESDDSDAENSPNLFANNRTASTSNSFVQRSAIDQELHKWDNLDITFTKNFFSFSQEQEWQFKKDATGLILQNKHNQTYWAGMVHVLPRMSKIMQFLLKTPVSSSNLERFFSTIS